MQMDVKTTPAYRAALSYEQFLVPGVFKYWTPLLLARANPRSGERVLDIATGTGVVARQMVPLVGVNGKVTGLDINPNMLAVACQQFSDYCTDIDWQQGEAENIPFHDVEFDLVTCQQGVQFFKDRLQAIHEMHRVLKPGGRAALEVFQSVECNAFFGHVYSEIAAKFGVPFSSLSMPFDFGEPEELGILLNDAGFHSVTNEELRQEVHFKEPEHFVEKIILSASAVLPALANIQETGKMSMVQEIQDHLASYFDQFLQNGELSFPMFANIATAVR